VRLKHDARLERPVKPRAQSALAAQSGHQSLRIQHDAVVDQLDRGDFTMQMRSNVISTYQRGSFYLAAEAQRVRPLSVARMFARQRHSSSFVRCAAHTTHLDKPQLELKIHANVPV
jgi:hypothetical protein